MKNKNTVTESKDKKTFKDVTLLTIMVDKWKNIISILTGSSKIPIDQTRPPSPKTIPDVRLRSPKVIIPNEIKINFQRGLRKILEEEKKGVVRRKRYGPY